jgi:uncharacterized spore protein YtfJ
MAATESEAMDEARRAAGGGPADTFIARMAERIGARASVTAVFGEPIQRGDLTIVPVARVRWGFGGGEGGGEAGAGEDAPASGYGSGGGGGVSADPIGFVEIGPDGAIFRPIVPPYPSPVFLLAAGLTVAFVVRALARLIRR